MIGRSADDMRREVDRLDDALSDMSNLVTALQFVLFDLAGDVIEDQNLHERRAALIGIGDALERVVKAAL